jgi:hypothetical protein
MPGRTKSKNRESRLDKSLWSQNAWPLPDPGDEIGHARRVGARQSRLEAAEDGAVGGTLDAIAIVKVKFTTNEPRKMVAAAFGVGVSVRNGRNVPFEFRNPNTPLVFDPA